MQYCAPSLNRWFSVFFFQAEDGIRYHCVTGVQTCALPISEPPVLMLCTGGSGTHMLDFVEKPLSRGALVHVRPRSEERRVGKECRFMGLAHLSKRESLERTDAVQQYALHIAMTVPRVVNAA